MTDDRFGDPVNDDAWPMPVSRSTLTLRYDYGYEPGDTLSIHLAQPAWHIRLWRWVTFYRAPLAVVREVKGGTMEIEYLPKPSLWQRIREWLIGWRDEE